MYDIIKEIKVPYTKNSTILVSPNEASYSRLLDNIQGTPKKA